MQYKTLGKTGLSVSVLSYGASPLGGAFRSVNEATALRTVHAALDLGINLIDVSPFYGLTLAETRLGKALKGVPRERYILATKVGRYGMEKFNFSAERVTQSVDESLARLGCGHIDLIQCHDIEFGDIQQVIHETIPALKALQQQGKVRFVGVTGLPLKIFRDVLHATNIDTILSYCHYTLNDVSLETLFPLCQQKQVGIINASPLGMGLLTERGVPDWHPAPPEIVGTCNKAVQHCKQRGIDCAHVAMQFCCNNELIASTLVGTANPDNIRRNVEWLDQPLDPEITNEVLRILAPIHNKTWPSGRRENND